MLKNKAEKKVPGGKLLRVTVETDESMSKIVNIMFTGDFYMHPEEEIHTLENMLNGAQNDENKLREIITKFFENEMIQILGAGPEDFLDILLTALRG
ncbi:lipoate protein ligase C-terminal domain-containing protein [Candidatus Borrarchaeum sp.]|uniref:lipoate protein ligase C-terminal domain-containing protein n=1 Tax=Candidatus Borrarchaeum sp. TaxID=2846742 RepID=UPI00257EF096|nr:lipoate protein ligase C-terminal domain-containing protein [Candidatus Borrarchaeum sp.]